MDTHCLQNLFKIDKYPQITQFQLFFLNYTKPRMGPPSKKKIDMELSYILIVIGFEPGEAFATRWGSLLLYVNLLKIAQTALG